MSIESDLASTNPKGAEPVLANVGLEQHLKTAPTLKSMLENDRDHGHGEASVREDEYKGHHIVVKTTYEVTVDGNPFHASLGVSMGGNVQYHGIPNVGFASAIELMRSVIDQFADEFPAVKGKRKKPATPLPDPAPSNMGHDHSGMAAMSMPPAGGPKKNASVPKKKAGARVTKAGK